METILRVPPSRGMVRFVPTTEECLAWGSKTVAGRISDAGAKDREVASEGEGSKSHERRILKVMKPISIRTCKCVYQYHANEKQSLSLRRSPASITPPSTQPPTPSRHGQEAAGNAAARTESADKPEGEENVKVIKKKKSIIHTLFRTRAEDEEPSVS